MALVDLVQIDAAYPIAILDLYRFEDGAQLRQGEEGDGPVAQDARLGHLWQQENLLNPGARTRRLGKGRLQPGSKNKDRLASSFGGVGGDLDEVEEL